MDNDINLVSHSDLFSVRAPPSLSMGENCIYASLCIYPRAVPLTDGVNALVGWYCLPKIWIIYSIAVWIYLPY